MTRLRSDRAALRRRLLHVLHLASSLDEVAEKQIVAAGYCFGGQCALDLARSGANFAAAVSFHGLFDPPGLPEGKISAKVVALGEELTRAGADWQIHAYGHVAHGFTNPRASDLQIDGVRYNALATERSWTSFVNLLEELFGGHA
jgi:dienelactone hydrolase